MENRRASAAVSTRPKPPEPASEEHSENPNWVSGLIYPARVIATGAGKILSTVFGPDSSLSSSSMGDSSSENDDDAMENDASYQGNDQLEKDVLPPTWKNENKRLIKQLVMRETFSREECDELTKIIESRVTNWIAESVNNTASITLETTPDVPTAIMEAKKWLQEKNLGSGSNLKLEHDAVPYVIKGWLGSPIDVAKSYMQDRPAWASPTLRHIEFKTTSPMGPQHSKDEMPITIFGNSLQPSQIQRSSVASGSWNILEEVQKVRSKATEELLASTSKKA